MYSFFAYTTMCVYLTFVFWRSLFDINMFVNGEHIYI